MLDNEISEKQRKKEEAQREREAREIGIVPIESNFVVDAGRRIDTAWNWIPRLKAIIVISMVISSVFMLMILFSVYSRQPAMIFLNLPNGTIACGPNGDANGNIVPRSEHQQKICDKLAPFSNNWIDSDVDELEEINRQEKYAAILLGQVGVANEVTEGVAPISSSEVATVVQSHGGNEKTIEVDVVSGQGEG